MPLNSSGNLLGTAGGGPRPAGIVDRQGRGADGSQAVPSGTQTGLSYSGNRKFDLLAERTRGLSQFAPQFQ